MAKATKTPAVKATSISRTAAVELIKKSKGRFFTATFIEADGTTLRKMNARYSSKNPVTDLGYIPVKDAQLPTGSNYRQINTRTLKTLTINKTNYKVK